MTKDLIQYSVVIPCYKSGKVLEELCNQIYEVLSPLGAFEIIMVNDASPDEITWPAIQRCAQKFPVVRGFNLLTNAGQFQATMCGFAQSRGEYVITMDDDLQHPPKELPKLISAIQNDPETLCYMGRYRIKHHNWFRNAGSKFYRGILHYLYGKPSNLQTSSFRIMTRALKEAVLTSRTAKPQISQIILLLTKKVKNIEVEHASRTEGQSGYTLKKLIKITLENIIYSSTIPMRILSACGLAASVVSATCGLYYLIRWCLGWTHVMGFTTLVLAIFFFGGMTLFGIGLLGEYLSRLIFEVTSPKGWFIKEDTEH